MKYYAFFLSIMAGFVMHAQSFRGVVLDRDNQPIMGAVVRSQDNKVAVNTDNEGKFSLANSLQYKYFIVSATGYLTDTISINSSQFYKLNLENKSLHEVKVNASKLSTFDMQTKFEDLVDAKELCKLACCNLSESFENSNTVDVVYSDGITGSKEIQMLGLAGSYTQILFENTPYIRGISQKIGLEQVPGTWIEGISINKGSGSVVNGYESMAGQINLDLKKPRKSDRAFFNLFISEIGKTDINFDASHRFSDAWATHLFLHTNFQPTKMDYFNDGFLDMPLTNNFNIFNRWQYSGSDKFAAQFGFQSMYENRSAGQISHENHINPNPYLVNIQSFLNTFYAKTGFSFNGDDQSLGITYRFSHNQQEGNIGLRDLWLTEIFGNINAIYQSHIFNNKNHLLKLGGSFQFDYQKEKLGDVRFDKDEKVPGVFVEHAYTKDSTMTIVLGLRYDNHNQWGNFLTPRGAIKFSPNSNWNARFTVGKGFRTVSLITENMGWMVSSRVVQIREILRPEESWNYGFNLKQDYSIGKVSGYWDASYFITQFENQIVTDVETNGVLAFYNLAGRSSSNSFQIDNKWIFSKNVDIKLSYKNDFVRLTYQGEGVLDKPLVNAHKWLVNPALSTNNGKWRLSTTLLLNGPGRIALKGHPDGTYSPLFAILHAVGTYAPHKNVDIYFGGENLTNFRQRNLIIDPENPFGNNFDAGMIWGTTDGRRMYIGMRWRIPYH
ncbi:MAG: TonB-dependent receptor [Chitinophagales bacterium]|nr:TonB-dependent receptor [Chitinophagales bacterium]